jgi:hypothetical protein
MQRHGYQHSIAERSVYKFLGQQLPEAAAQVALTTILEAVQQLPRRQPDAGRARKSGRPV